MKKSMLSVSILMLALGATGAAWAQPSTTQSQTRATPVQPTSQPSQELTSADVSDEDVTRFAKAQEKVEDIKTEYSQEVQKNADDPKKAMAVQQEAQQKIVDALDDAGIDPVKYDRIAQAQQYDNTLRQRIEAVN